MFKAVGYRFQWKDLGDIETGRPHLGANMPVAVYRLMQYTLRERLIRRLSTEEATDILREAGWRAGTEFCANVLDRSLPFDKFLAHVQDKLQGLKIGLLRMEHSDLSAMEFTLTVSEDLDCSGLPFLGETVCEYDEGFIAGLLEGYTGEHFEAREVDCWASGDRTCRFRVTRRQ
ncbi:MAG: V4R domain-containing protein [Thermodesulfobacteriota bacterium]